MSYRIHRLFAFIGILICLPFLAHSQEFVTGLACNPVIAKAAKQQPRAAKNGEALPLPFVEDFSVGIGYPDVRKWQDRLAFVNNSFPIYPPSIGAVTMDALDAQGVVYPQASREAFPADTLTSSPIRLDSNFTHHRPMYVSDSLYFSFYYQPGGGSRQTPPVEWERVGDAPEFDDELILEFGYATGNIIFMGYTYGEYTIGPDEYYVAGDTIDNPFIPGLIYIFESNAFPGETILMPYDSIFGPEYVWNEVWSTHGCTLDSWLAENPLQYFKQVLIPITDPQYLRNNFQFRFRNYASLDLDAWSSGNIVGWASNCDQWHIDYIRLDVDRYANDLYPNDVAFVSPTTSALSLYQSMPWHQYRTSDMGANFHNDLSNLSSATKNTFYNYSVKKDGVTNIYTSTVNNENASPYHTNGLHTYPYHAEPAINFSYTYDNEDSASFTITHVFRMEGANDELLRNDTCSFEQKFYNYYAFDDGTAEGGYCLLSSQGNPDASLAVQFTLAQPDTLRCVRMYFNHALNNENVDYFTLMVWDDNNGQPGNVIYSMESQLPAFGEEYLQFVNYYPEEPVAIEGTFYVGFRQTHNTQLNLGFDQNNDARGHFFYKTTNEWRESFYRGAPMIRPVVGKAYDHSGIRQPQEQTLKLYPNPTTGDLFIGEMEETDGLEYQIFDLYGRMLDAQPVEGGRIRTAPLVPGMYMVRILKDHSIISTEKIIKH